MADESFPGSAWRDNSSSTFAALVSSSSYVSKFSSPSADSGVNASWSLFSWQDITASAPPVNPFRNFNAWINSIIFPESFVAFLYEHYGPDFAHYGCCYVRNLVSGMIIYYLTAGFFHYKNYVLDREKLFSSGKRQLPTREVIIDQIQLAQTSLFFYVALPVFSDWLIEEGYTMTYYDILEVGGLGMYLLYTLAYFVLVEIGIYWMHRTLHTNKFLYKYVHALHHSYNSPETLTPWASIAFNPLDGILQASPYVFWLVFIPCHYLTHVAMLFCTAIWATYIHDTMDGDLEPIMGNKYHTIHHTHYMYNFGQIFLFCDWYWGTLRTPTKPTGQGLKKKMKAKAN